MFSVIVSDRLHDHFMNVSTVFEHLNFVPF